MLDDRSYMRSPSYEPRLSATAILLIVNAVIFVFQEVLGFWGPGFRAPREIFGYRMTSVHDVYWFVSALSLDGLKHGFLWQLVTYQFMHAGLMHLLVNSIVIFFFGRAMEETLGKREFLKLYFAAGIAGGLLQMFFAVIAPNYFDGPVVGASASGFGLIAAFATLFPERLITLLLFFVIPVSFRAKFLLWFAIGISVLGIAVPANAVADAAHLGGILLGVAYARWVVQGGWSISFRTSRPRRESVHVAGRSGFWKRQSPVRQEPEELPPADFISREVDPILDKISAHGIQSLTERERKILEAARSKMAKR